MKLVILAAAVAAMLAVTATAPAGPITKQNGSTSASTSFTSICSARDGFWRSWYYDCPSGFQPNGSYVDPFRNVSGRINAVQTKPNVYSLDVAVGGLAAGASYTLWGNLNGTFFVADTRNADASGKASFSYKYAPAAGDKLGFDVNRAGYTVVTTYWNGETLSLDAATGLLVTG